MTAGGCAPPRYIPHITLSAPNDSRRMRATKAHPAHHPEAPNDSRRMRPTKAPSHITLSPPNDSRGARSTKDPPV